MGYIKNYRLTASIIVLATLAAPVVGGAPPANVSCRDRFGRMFDHLHSFAPPTGKVRAALMELGKPGGILDAEDDLTEGPVALIVNPALSANNRNNPTHTAGTTFMGQFLDRDMMFDMTSRLGHPTNPRTVTNARTPEFDLDTVYGAGPVGSPLVTIPAGTPPTSLSQRNLLRHLTWSLPSGQAIARHIGAPLLNPADLADAARISKSFATSTPLWLYVLREAELTQDGLHLGAVGGRIVGEVFIGLLETDPDSFINAQPDFVPTLPTQTGNGEDFRMIDFLTFAGVDPDSRGQ